MSQLSVRMASPEDAAALVDIYAPYVQNTAVTYEYAVPSVEEFAGRIEATLRRFPYLVAEKDGRIVGYAYAGTFIGRAASDWTAEVSIYIERDCRRSGAGRALYAALEGILGMQNIINLIAVIACSPAEDEYLTADSIAFHSRMGYQRAGVVDPCGCKFGRWYGLMWMQKLIGECPASPAAVVPLPQILPEAQSWLKKNFGGQEVQGA